MFGNHHIDQTAGLYLEFLGHVNSVFLRNSSVVDYCFAEQFIAHGTLLNRGCAEVLCFE